MAQSFAFPTRGEYVREGVFITATDTGVGKTLVSAVLCTAWDLSYWKPVQTGAALGDDDTATIRRLAQLPNQRIFAPGRVYADPSAPERAAALEGQRVSVAELTAPPPRSPLLVEGAGGALVPLNDSEDMTHLMRALALPVLVVARSTLGTINHTLLTLEALHRRQLDVLGVILNGPPSPHNRDAIERHGHVTVLAELDWLPEVTPQAIRALARQLGGSAMPHRLRV